MQKKIRQIFSDFEIIAYELVVLNSRFYWETIHFIGCPMVTKSLKILDTSKAEFFGLIFFQSDQKIWQKFCRAYLSRVPDPLTCCLSISVMTRGFLGI